MLVEDMDDDTTYEMWVDGAVRMLARSSFFKALIAHPKVIEAFDNINTGIPDVEYR